MDFFHGWLLYAVFDNNFKGTLDIYGNEAIVLHSRNHAVLNRRHIFCINNKVLITKKVYLFA